MTVSLFSEVAHHPTSLWISIAKSSYTHTLLQQQPEFSLAVLNEKQKGIAITCGTVSGRDANKTRDLQLYSKSDGFLYLSGALASTSCRLRGSFEIDDHTVFIGDILEADLESRTSHLRQLLMSDLQK